MKTILLSGSSGYLGLRLEHFLNSRSSFQIRAASTKSKKWPFLLENDSNFHIITHGAQFVIHLAGKNAQSCEEKPLEAYVQNRDSTLSLYKSSVQNNVELFIFASTIHVYGSPLRGTLNESGQTTPVSIYAKSKIEAEQILFANKSPITKIKILRLSNIVGAPERVESCDWNLIVNSLCRDAIIKKEISLRTNGLGVRNFLSIRDFEKSVFDILSLKEHSDFEIINLGGKRNYSMAEIAEIISEEYFDLFKERIPIKFGEAVDPTSDNFMFSVEKAKSMNLSLDSDIRDDIREMLMFCNKNFNNA